MFATLDKQGSPIYNDEAVPQCVEARHNTRHAMPAGVLKGPSEAGLWRAPAIAALQGDVSSDRTTGTKREIRI